MLYKLPFEISQETGRAELASERAALRLWRGLRAKEHRVNFIATKRPDFLSSYTGGTSLERLLDEIRNERKLDA